MTCKGEQERLSLDRGLLLRLTALDGFVQASLLDALRGVRAFKIVDVQGLNSLFAFELQHFHGRAMDFEAIKLGRPRFQSVDERPNAGDVVNHSLAVGESGLPAELVVPLCPAEVGAIRFRARPINELSTFFRSMQNVKTNSA